MNQPKPNIIFKICYFLVISLLLVNCNREKKGDKNLNNEQLNISIPQHKWLGKEVNTEALVHFDTLISSKSYTSKNDLEFKIVYYFNGECSTCIASLIDWHNNIKSKNDMDCVYVSFGIDTEILQYYLDETKVKLNHTLLHDKKGLFKNSNSFMKENESFYTYIFLIDKQNKIIAFGSPFNAENVMKIYKKNDILK